MTQTAVAKPSRRNIAELQAGERIEDEIYRVAQKDLRTTTTGSLYIHAVLADATGELIARVWNASQAQFDAIVEGGYLHVRGRVENYKGARQFVLDGMRAVLPGEVDPSDFLPATSCDVEQMWARLTEILRGIRNPDLLALIGRFLRDEAFVAGYKKAPAARHNHHAYLGGLLEHTLSLAELALLVAPRYPDVSLDLVLAGIFLHDAGKIAEMAYDTNIEYTDEGHLIGHIVQAAVWVHEKARELAAESGRPFPADVLNSLCHIIVAHHGKYEFGSPKLPATPEAVIVHYLDNLDAKVHMMLTEIRRDPDATSRWTGFVRALETRVFKPDVMGVRK